MKLSHLIITFAAISISGCTVDSTQKTTTSVSRLDLYGSKHKVTLHSKTKPQGEAAEEFELFKKGGPNGKGYYGAFAYSLGGGAYTSITGDNSLKTAREAALAGCIHYRKNNEAPCKIIAVLIPTEYIDKQKITLSKSATKKFRGLKNKGKYRAFASDNAGFTSRVWGYETQGLANLAVLRRCNLNAKAETPKHQRLYPCLVIPEE